MNSSVTREIKDVYEVAYYVMHGARITSARRVPQKPKRKCKKRYPYQWIVTVIEIKPKFIKYWESGKAYGNITQFSYWRNRTKKTIQNLIREKYY